MPRDDLLLEEMIDASARAIEIVGRLDPADTTSDRDLLDALLWNFTVLGEAARGGGVTGSEREAGVCLPPVLEATGRLELVVVDRLTPVGGHTAPPDGRELRRIADGDQAPRVSLGQVDERH